MLLSLLSLLGGGLMRMLPEVLGLLNRKEDNAHELLMLDKQFQLEQLRSQIRMDEMQMQGNFADALALLDAQKDALAGQMQKTGFWFVDALNFLVRPTVTYILLGLYLAHKLGGALLLYGSNRDLAATFVSIYTPEDFSVLQGVLAFWFVGRVFDKNAR